MTIFNFKKVVKSLITQETNIMASVKQIKGYIAANKKALVALQAKVKKQEAALKKAVAAEKKKPAKKKVAKKAAPKKKVVKKKIVKKKK